MSEKERERILGELERELGLGPELPELEAVGLPEREDWYSWAEVGRRALELLRGDVLEAWEIDGGPSGRWWELGTGAEPETVATREAAAAAGAVVFHTVAEWELEREAEAEAAELEAERELVSGTFEAELGADGGFAWHRVAEAGRDRMDALEARVGRLERLAEDERSERGAR